LQYSAISGNDVPTKFSHPLMVELLPSEGLMLERNLADEVDYGDRTGLVLAPSAAMRCSRLGSRLGQSRREAQCLIDALKVVEHLLVLHDVEQSIMACSPCR
jgi:hypothetical protein